MNALDLKYNTDYLVIGVGSPLKGEIVRRSKWVNGSAVAKSVPENNTAVSVAMHLKGSDRGCLDWWYYRPEELQEVV